MRTLLTILAWLVILVGVAGALFVVVFNVLMQDHPQPWWPILAPVGLILAAVFFLHFRRVN